MDITTLREKLAPVFAEIQARESFSPFDMTMWVAENINAVWKDLTHTRIKQFDPGRFCSDIGVEIIDGKPHLIVIGQWKYNYTEGHHPQLSLLSELMPGVQVRPGAKSQYRIEAKLVFDLDAWPCFLLPTLYQRARFALLQEQGLSHLREKALEHALALAKHYFPSLNINVLNMGVELDLFTNIETFKTLCHKHAPLHQGTDILPGNLV